MSLQKEDCLFLKMIPKSRQQPNNEAIEVSREARRSRDHVNFTYSRASCLAQLVLLVFPALPSSAPPWQLPLSPCRVIMSKNASHPKGRLTRGDMLQGHVAGKNYLGCFELLFRIIESTGRVEFAGNQTLLLGDVHVDFFESCAILRQVVWLLRTHELPISNTLNGAVKHVPKHTHAHT